MKSGWLQLALLMLAMALAPGHASAQEVEIRAAQVAADAGEDIVIPVSFQSGEPVVAAQFDLSFDVLALQPALTTGGNSLTNHHLDFEEVAPGLLRVVITTASLSVLQDGELAAIGFKVSLDALPGEYPLVLGNLVLADGEGDEVAADVVEDGLVTIYNESLTGIPTLSWPGYLLLTVLLAGLGWVFLRQGAQGVAFSFLLGCVLFTSVLRAVTPPGDANDDGNVNTDDIPVIVAEILEREAAPGDPDCNEDEAVDVRDTVCAALADEDANRPPVLDPIANQLAQEDELLEITATADDPDLPGDTLEFSLDTAPAGMSVDPASGLISWTPAGNQVGSHPVTVRVTDEGGLFDTTSFQVTVEEAPNRPPMLTAISDVAVDDGVLFQVTAMATDPDLPDDVLVFSLDTAPTGMSINPTSGLVSWTPAVEQIGANPVTVRVTDQENLFDTTSFTVTVTDSTVNSAPTLLAPGNRIIRANSPFKANLFATDPDLGDTLTFSLPSGPGDLAVDPVSGELDWTPGSSDLGSHPVTARVTDAAGLFDEKSFAIEVTQETIQAASNQPPQLTVPPSQEIVFGNPLNVSASASDPDIGDTLVFSLTSAPAGLGIDSNSGAISWTPVEAQVGAHDVTVKVTDSAGAVALGSFVVTVLDINRAPVAVDEVYEARLGETLVIAAPGVLDNDSDPEGDSLTAGLVTDVDKGDLTLLPDGSFTYLLEPTLPNAEVELEPWCSNSLGDGDTYQTNGTPAVGDVDNDGTVEIVGTGWTSGRSFLAEIWIMNAEDCSQQFSTGSVVEDAGGFEDESQVGLLDIDNDGDLEIIVPRGRYPFDEGGNFDGKHLMALHHDGSFAWGGNHGSETPTLFTGTYNYWGSGATFSDIDADGTPEIIMAFSTGSGANTYSGLVVYNAEDGSIQWEFLSTFRQNEANIQKMPYIADLDLDGTMEVIVHNSVVSHEGVLEFELPSDPAVGTSAPGHLFLGIANFDDDPYPELIGRDNRNHYLFEHDGTIKWKQELPKVASNQINVADFDGDGEPEFSYVTCTDNLAFGNCNWQGLAVYDTDGSLLWKHENDEDLRIDRFYADRANATAFDANGDGAFDLVFRNEMPASRKLYIIDGRDGSVLESVTAWAYTGTQRFTVVADVNGDGHAEIINTYTGGIQGQTEIWTGTAENPLPKAPPMRNQWNFSEAYVDEDFTLPTNPVPHWLQPGGNGYHLIRQQPDPLVGTTASFQYAANDGALDSNTATVTLDILPAGNPPVFLTQPDTLTTRGFPYAYAPIVVDADLGDTVQFQLMAAPTGMTMDPASGALSWLPDVIGEFNVSILAYDTIGYATDQTFVLEVGEPVVVPDVVGQPEASAESTLNTENLLVGKIRRITDATIPAGSVISQQPPAGSVTEFGGSVDLWISLGPAPEDIDDDGDGFPETGGDCDDTDDSIFPGATDSVGDGIDQDCDGIDGNLVLESIVVTPEVSNVLTDQVVRLKAFGIFEDGTSQNLTGVVSWSDGPVFSSASAGSFVITATRGAIDGSATVNVSARESGDDVPPTALITSPASNTTITEPVEIIGTASDANFLRYDLEYAIAGSDEFTLLASGTSPVNSGVLGEFDPTLLVNDLYTIRLAVYDLGGNVEYSEISLQVDEDLKLGNFTLGFTDLTIPVAGIPITVTRSYDSREKRSGDFGVGWFLDFGTIRLNTNRVLGTGWQVLKQGLSYGLVATDNHTVSITFPDGWVERFDMVVAPSSSPIVPFPPFSQSVSYTPQAGTLGQLKSLEENFVSILDAQPGPAELRRDSDGQVYNPQRFRYTAVDGTIIDIHKTDGIEKVTDTNGNSLTFGPAGIVHSSGKSVTFVRDGLGRVTEITDPNGNSQFYSYDGNGDLRQHTDAEGNVSSYTYDLDHHLLDMVTPEGIRFVRNEYDSDGRLVATTDANGNTVEVSHDVGARQQTVTDRRGNVTVYSYDEEGNELSRTNALGHTYSYTYDANGNITSETDPLGNTQTHTYDASNNLLTTLDALGNLTTNTYDANKNLLSTTDPSGNTTTFAYDSRGNLIETTDPLGNTTYHTYDSKGNELSVTDALGHTFVSTYDASGNRTSHTDPLGNTTNYVYDANGNQLTRSQLRTTSSGPELLTTTHVYDGRNLLTEKTDPAGNKTFNTYDARGNKVATVDPNGHQTRFEYDALKRRIKSIYPDGTETHETYDANGNRLTSVDRAGRTTSHVYDVVDRVISTTYPGGATETHAYDAAGRVTMTTDALGNATSFGYDAAGNQTSITDALGNVMSYGYDANGRKVAATDPNGNTTGFEYDANGELTKTTFADGSFTSVQIDELGRKSATTDQAGLTTQYAYDALGRLTHVTDALGQVTTYGYDEVGNQLSQTDTNGNTTYKEYDPMGRVIRTILPLGMTQTHTYDANGNEVARTDYNGDTTTYAYDEMNRLISKSLPGGETVDFTYTDTGERAGVADHRGFTAYSYDERDRLLQQVEPDGSTLDYTYDLNGNRTSVTTASGSTTYTFDALNRTESITDANSGITTYGYDNVGNRVSTSYPNGVVATYAYDSQNRLVLLENRKSDSTLISSFAYTLGLSGKRVQVTENSGRTVAYSYDPLYRLTEENITDPLLGNEVITYTYDPVGNRLTKSDSSDTSHYSYDANDRLLDDGEHSYGYDSNGNAVSHSNSLGTTVFAHDAENRLVSISRPGGSLVQYDYDADGRRVQATADGQETHYLVDRNRPYAQVLEERDDLGSLQVAYTYADDLISQDRSGVQRFYLYDGHGSSRQLTDGLETVTDSYTYDAFGIALDSTGSTDNNYQYAGEQYDADAGKYYLRARYYDQGTGRFPTTDPYPGDLDTPMSLHRYLYTHADPVNHVDPSGELLAEVMITVAIGAVVYGTAAFIIHQKNHARRVGAVTGAAQVVVEAAHQLALNPQLGDYPREFSDKGKKKFVQVKHADIWEEIRDQAAALKASGEWFVSIEPSHVLQIKRTKFAEYKAWPSGKFIGLGQDGAGAAQAAHLTTAISNAIGWYNYPDSIGSSPSGKLEVGQTYSVSNKHSDFGKQLLSYLQ